MTNKKTELNIFVGRQAIFDHKKQVVAYELLYRTGTENFALIEDDEQATTDLLINSLVDIGLDRIVGNHPAFFNLTGGFIRNNNHLPMSSKQVVLEILESVEPTPEIIAGMKELVEKGYTLALDDFNFAHKLIPMLELAHIIKLEVMGKTRAELQIRMDQLQPYGVKLLAEKVETEEEFALCVELGFDYFQGYFLCRPNIIKGRSMPASRLVLLNMLSKLYDPDTDIEELEQLIIQDVSLTYRLLRFINSGTVFLGKKVESVRRALILVGTSTIKKWVNLLLLARIDNKPRELMRTALIRGRMSELLAERHGHRKGLDRHFTCGLFSVLDALLDQPMEELLAELPLIDEVKQALLTGTGEFGEVLQEVLNYEKGAWEELDGSMVVTSDLRDSYLQAVMWADESMNNLHEGAAARSTILANP